MFAGISVLLSVVTDVLLSMVFLFIGVSSFLSTMFLLSTIFLFISASSLLFAIFSLIGINNLLSPIVNTIFPFVCSQPLSLLGTLSYLPYWSMSFLFVSSFLLITTWQRCITPLAHPIALSLTRKRLLNYTFIATRLPA